MQFPREFTRVTSFSKFLAFFLFITLPFIAFGYGYYYGTVNPKYIESETVKTSQAEVFTEYPTATPRPKNTSHIYENNIFGYRLDFPEGYSSIEGRAVSEADRYNVGLYESLRGNEIQKVVFVEDFISESQPQWPGKVELAVLLNPDGLTIEEYADEYNPRTATDASLIRNRKQTTLGGLPAVEFEVFGFDHGDSVTFALYKGLILRLTYEYGNPNDPDFERHSKEYEKVRNSLTFFKRS